MAEEGKEKKPEEKPEPLIEFGLGLGGLLKGLGEFIGQAAKLAEEAKVLENAGVSVERRVLPHGMYGVSVKISPRGPVFGRFGTIKIPNRPGVAEDREPLVDIFENEREITLTAELPGVEEKDIKIEVEERTVKISAEGEERRYWKEVELHTPIGDQRETSYKNGVLELRLKKKNM